MAMTATVTQALRTYLSEVQALYSAGNATEHSYRPALQRLLTDMNPRITATNEPKRIACGAPDYSITRADASGPRTVGYIEAKDVGVSLTETEKTDQLKRYRMSLDNLILTDYLEFRWYVGGESRMSARLATVGAGHKLTWDAEGAERVADMLMSMLGQKAPDITSPDDLARRMARMAHMIRNVALDTLRSASSPDAEQVKAAREELTGLFETFKETLLPDLTDEAFADMFAQTLAYGLFAARYNHSGAQPFTRRDAAREIPRSNPFLRRLFTLIEHSDLDDAPYIGFVDDLAQLLATTDMAAVLRDFGKRTRTEDPIVHFYEPFLQAYDAKLRELRGVYYTPEPIVSYIVRSVDALLKRDFSLPEGLASGGGNGSQPVMLLDPACGTGTFLSSVVNYIRDRFRTGGAAGAWDGYVRQRLLPRIFGFELLMAPYAMAHLRLGMQLAGLDMPESERERWRFQAGDADRLGVYLTNTLDQAAKRSERILGGQFISDEANAAAKVKRDAPVMVVLGNPPYSGHSANTSDWIMALLRGEDLTNTQGDKPLDRGKGRKTDNYFMVDGAPLGERNPKWLNDDYVKFIRFAQWRIERTGHGVLAFVTNHGYLDNPTFRGMRQSLMRTFDEIYLLDLHGNSKKKERTPDGGKDENVFDIQQGVAIGIFVRRQGQATGDRHAIVRHAHLWGERAGKYEWLAAHDAATTAWSEVAPTSPMYFFIPRDARLAEEYEAGWSLEKAIPADNLGITTSRDDFVIDSDEAVLRRRIAGFLDSSKSDNEVQQLYLSPRDSLPVANARKELAASGWKDNVVQALYRPFDKRYMLYHTAVLERPRVLIMRHMIGHANLAIATTRMVEIGRGWEHILCTREPIQLHTVSLKEVNYLFPLYLYPDPSDTSKPRQSDMFASAEAPSTAPGGRRANLAPEFTRDFGERLGLAWVPDGKGDRVATFGPEDVFSYIYAVLHSPAYRERYADFLKSDFPRIPLTRDAELFRALCALGDRLVALHLMEATAPGQPGYPVKGSDTVEAVRYLEPDPARGALGRVYINAEQYFDGVAPEVWEFHIGGYQVAEKWLKDRKGRKLTFDDIEHYWRTIAALAETRTLMAQIDEAIEEHGGWPLG